MTCLIFLKTVTDEARLPERKEEHEEGLHGPYKILCTLRETMTERGDNGSGTKV